MTDLNRLRVLAGLLPLLEAKGVEQFVIVNEEEWDKDYPDGGGESRLEIYEVQLADLDKYGDWENDGTKLSKDLESGKVGTKTGKTAKVFNKDPDSGSEGNQVSPKSVNMLFPNL